MMKNDLKRNRAWIEINLKHLEHNIHEIQRVIPKNTKIMAVVKANAYGHDLTKIAKKLNQIGIQDFAVATLEEAITLRKHDIDGNILILGYTDLTNIHKLLDYDLIQTILDYDYAQKISQMDLKEKLKVHVKINTGMNRIGENYQNIDHLIEIYQMKNLQILGTYSHMSASDSKSKEDISFTYKQIDHFFQTIHKLKTLGLNPGKIHIQASYGILNYPNLPCDYVRPGIIMYGVYSNTDDKTNIQLHLKPVLSLKAKISSVREIQKGESVSYNRTFVAKQKMKIASVSIGYADGYPRNLSNQNTKVLVHKKYAKIIGRICMDQLVLDVSNIDHITAGDIVTLIGEKSMIRAEKIAYDSNTITNELLSRLGSRLPIISKR